MDRGAGRERRGIMVRNEWKSIYETYYKQLYLYSLSLVGNKHDAEDLLQETFVKAYLSYTNSGSIKYWLVTVLRNTYLNWQKKRAKEVLDDGDQYLKKAVSPDDLLSDYIEKENRRRLFSEIQKLPVQMKTVLMESVYLQMSDEEIGRLHGLTTENVRKIRSRAKQRLISRMKEEA